MIHRNVKEKSKLEEAIDHVLNALNGMDPDDPKYESVLSQLDTLYQLKQLDKPKRIERDTLVTVGGNLIAVLIIVGYESRNVITSKALNFIPKFR